MTFNPVIPELAVSNIEESLRFYTEVLPFRVSYHRKESKFFFLSLGDAQIMIQEDDGTWNTGELEKPYGRGMNLQIEVPAIAPLLDRLAAEQYPLFVAPKEQWYRKDDVLLGQKEFLVQDPDGYVLRFSEDIGEKPRNTP